MSKSNVNNLAFFRIVDKQVREAMQQVETEMLPTARQALSETGLVLQKHPVEGYYGKTQKLTNFFNHIKTLQLNYSDKVGDAVKKLHEFYTNEVFGLGQALITPLNSEGVWYPLEPPVVISPMVDPLTAAVVEVGNNPTTIYQDLTVENIAKVLENFELGKGLVGLGSLVDRLERKKTGEYNPIATTLARETTVLSAYVPTLKCMPEYKVSSKVEAHGNAVINAYNSLFKKAGFNVKIPNITRKNAFQLNHDLPEMDRCVRVFNLDLPGQDKEFYHWAIGIVHYQTKVIDFWRKEVITTDMFKQASERYQNKRRA